MQSSTKLAIGILSAIPLLGTILYTTLLGYVVLNGFADGSSSMLEQHGGKILAATVILVLSATIGLGLLITFIIFAIKDRSANENEQVIWVILLILLSILIFPFYWYLRIWSNPNFGFEASITDRNN